jgi:hypothetical protein
MAFLATQIRMPPLKIYASVGRYTATPRATTLTSLNRHYAAFLQVIMIFLAYIVR